MTKATSPEPINEALAEHQRKAEGWKLQPLLADLHSWEERMVLEFKLQIGHPALMVDPLRRTRFGHHRYGRNGFGLVHEVALNLQYLNRPYWQILGTLFHELLHAWQEEHGTPGRRNYHNQEFREKAKSLGLLVAQNGVTQYAPPPSPFLSLLEQYKVEVPELPKPIEKEKGRSKLHLWQCPCGVKVRVGRAEFRAKCLDCGDNFSRKDGPGGEPKDAPRPFSKTR